MPASIFQVATVASFGRHCNIFSAPFMAHIGEAQGSKSEHHCGN
jgi:hypothetical protein